MTWVNAAMDDGTPFINMMALCQVDMHATGLHKRGCDAVC